MARYTKKMRSSLTTHPLVIGASVLVASALFSACANGQSQPALSLSEQQDLGTLTQETTQRTSNLDTTTSKKMETTMKQLSDFEQIPATQATIKTTKGEITFELYQELAPLTTANFLNLAKSGYYDGIVFHRVIADFMAQVGDPLTKQAEMKGAWGSGGPGYTIADEFGAGLAHETAGMVSMANAGPNSGGSQFFITYGPTPWLDGKHAIFGKVTQGMDVVNQIVVGDKILGVTYQ